MKSLQTVLLHINEIANNNQSIKILNESSKDNLIPGPCDIVHYIKVYKFIQISFKAMKLLIYFTFKTLYKVIH